MGKPSHRFWFPAKKYGWGWGLPTTWQGWVFLSTWLAVVLAGTALRPAHPVLYALFVVGMVAVLLAVCLAKGEPPRWRWGDSDRTPRG